MAKRGRSTCGVLALALTIHNVAAQQVLGRAVREIDGAPLEESLIVMLDQAGHETARALTNPGGGFDLRAPPGRYHVRVQRIGQYGWQTPPFDLAAEQIYKPTLRVPDSPFELKELDASVPRPNCSVTLGDASLGAKLLEAAQTALALAQAAITEGKWSYTTETYRRTVPTEGAPKDSVVSPGRLSGWPIQSADPDSLRLKGFVQGDYPVPSRFSKGEIGPTYFGPDARVLFTDWFLESHCISVESRSAWVVARFKPAKGTREAAALEGSLEFDRGTLALRSLSFQFDGRPPWAPPEGAGGAIRFARLPDGAWLPVNWKMVIPIPAVAGDELRYSFFGVFEVGGRVTEIRGADGRRDSRAEAAALETPK